MADQQWFYQQQPAYGYDPYGQPADVPTSAAEYHYGSYYQQNGHPQQQSAALEPLYGQQIIDAALSYGQYGAAAAPGAYVGYDGFGAAYIAAPHDVQQHHHQLQQPHQMQHIQYSVCFVLLPHLLWLRCDYRLPCPTLNPDSILA